MRVVAAKLATRSASLIISFSSSGTAGLVSFLVVGGGSLVAVLVVVVVVVIGDASDSSSLLELACRMSVVISKKLSSISLLLQRQ